MPSCLHGADESQKSTRQIKKVCQDNDLPKPDCLQDEEIQAKLLTSHRQKPDKHSTDQESLSRQRSTYTELFTWHRLKLDKHSSDQESLSRQRST